MKRKTPVQNIIDFAKAITKRSERRYIYHGIYYRDGYAYFTDGRIAGKTKLIYLPELEEKCLSLSEYTYIEGNHPKYDAVFNRGGYKEIEHPFEIPEFIYKLGKVNDPSIFIDNEFQFSLKKTESTIMGLNMNILKDLKCFRDSTPRVYYRSSEKPLILEYENLIEIVIMGIRL